MHDCLKALALAVVTALGLMTWTTSVSRCGEPQKSKPHHLDPNGEPKGFKAGETERYAIWRDDQGWRLRSTTAGKEHHFRGSLTVEGGTLADVHSAHLEKEGKLEDHWKVGPKHHELTFDFKTDKGIDGINFHVSKDAKEIKFELLIDGKEHKDRVFVGHEGHHPAQLPFLLPAHPHPQK